MRLELSSREAIDRCLAELEEEHIDVLVNNAGQFAGGLTERLDTSKLSGIDPDEWAAKIVTAIEDDDEILNPAGAERLAKLASRGPAGLLDAVLTRAFDR